MQTDTFRLNALCDPDDVLLLLENSLTKISERHGRRKEGNIKINIRENKCEGVDWIKPAQDRTHDGLLEYDDLRVI
jgi:hypothetical protein